MFESHDTENTSEIELADTSWFTSPCDINNSTESDEWYTPKKYVDLVKEVFGGEIDLDPFSCEFAQRIVQAKHYYTKEQNALEISWACHKLAGNKLVQYPARAFCNPPYSCTGDAANKLFSEYEQGNIASAILLTNTTITDREWFHKLSRFRNNFAICLVKQRIKYYRQGQAASNPRDASMFTYLGDSYNNFNEYERFTRVFSSIGLIVK